MDTYHGLRIKMDHPSHWTIIFERQADGSLDIMLAHGENSPKQGRLLTPEEVETFCTVLDLKDDGL